MLEQEATPDTQEWFLEGLLGQGRTWSIHIDPLPFMIGRQTDCHLHLIAREISRCHAQIYRDQDRLWVRDLGSTNGTYLNHHRIGAETPLKSGDVLHFGSLEFRVSYREFLAEEKEGPSTGIFISPPVLPQQFVSCAAEFDEMIGQEAALTLFQPIVTLPETQLIGYEVLGRGNYPGLPNDPRSLFGIAERLGREVELSELFRRIAINTAQHLPEGLPLFLNNHPAELDVSRMIESFQEIRQVAPSLSLILEINEKVVTDLSQMRRLREVLRDLDVGLAYDDFGAGQGRLMELIEVPPDYLKFDAMLIRNIHRQPTRFRQVLQTLVQMTKDLGIIPLAEGIECSEEAAVCTWLGFETAQGYYYGRPGLLPKTSIT